MARSFAHSSPLGIIHFKGLVETGWGLPIEFASGNSASACSGAVSTTNANDLIIGTHLGLTGTLGPGAGFISRMITVPDSDIAEDKIVTTTGGFAATVDNYIRVSLGLPGDMKEFWHAWDASMPHGM
jgi:hypothetical protein